MKWDKYKQLTVEQKEEYTHKFDNESSVLANSLQHTIFFFLIFKAMILLELGFILMIYHIPSMAHLKYLWTHFATLALRFTVLGTTTIVLLACASVARAIYYHHKESCWYKKAIESQGEVGV